MQAKYDNDGQIVDAAIALHLAWRDMNIFGGQESIVDDESEEGTTILREIESDRVRESRETLFRLLDQRQVVKS